MKWDGSSWTTLGTGFVGAPLAFASFEDGCGRALFAGGAFTASPGGDSHLAKLGCRPKQTTKKRRL